MATMRQRSARRLAIGAGSALLVALGLLPGSPAAQAETVPRVVPRAAAPAAADACGAILGKPEGGTWSCTFVDHFAGNGQPVDDKWLAGETRWSGFRVDQTCIKAGRPNVALRRGTMVLTARDEGAPFTCRSPLGDFDTRYTGASVGTRGRFSQTYGRFEIRAKLPDTDQTGLHAAFWLYPNEHTYGRWPHSGEIDIAEWWSGSPTTVLPSLHYSGRTYWGDSGWWCSIADVSKYHTYAVEWTPQEMRFYQDGQQCWTRTWQPDSPLVAPQPFDHPFNIALTMAVDKETGNNAVGPHTDLPAEFVIDYVKAWQ
ncbi:glycoside hydrolase family 16 protein [Nocardioides panacisoli]|uniref:glycoside hydrolase family 16 protein n=1 Tax=Nocardioides panacisoli TaxID=627624 RepID=UPI001C62D970|nr:glycoside hydrolase family 16 protein [Nocardioides panacisoli]QYJ03900.1 glycoside hydrolase family 16 protein [Nocardioides panacisoli]